MGAKPKQLIMENEDYSILVACRLVRDGYADALVSAGSTGATILAAAQYFNRLPGIRRAALASVYPTASTRGPKSDPFALILDVGATLTAEADDLVGFAIMGAAYSRVISEHRNPRVSLLSNGAEATKGTPAIIQANTKLCAGKLNFIGNIEGLDIPKGTTDVVVCDGFLGNVVLKMLEGIGEVLNDLTKQASNTSIQWRIGLSMLGDGMKQLKSLTDWNAYGGAPLLGLDQVIIKAHGRSHARAVRNAIKVAAKAVRGGLVLHIREGLACSES